MFCVNCGKPYDSTYRFCNYCGGPLQALASLKDGGDGSTNAQGNPIEPPPIPFEVEPGAPTGTPKTTCFQRLAVSYVGLLISCCAVVLGISEYYASIGVEYKTSALSRVADTLFVISATAVVIFAVLTVKAWKVSAVDRRANRLAVVGTVYLVLVTFLCGLFGNSIGQSRRSLVRVRSEINSVNEVGRRIGQARSAKLNYISEYISVYRGLEADVDEYESANRKLEADLQEYNMRFPEESKSTIESLANTRVELRRVALLRKQISVLKEVEELDPNLQVQMWQSSFVPLLKEEDKLN
jgi:hypothetical protein